MKKNQPRHFIISIAGKRKHKGLSTVSPLINELFTALEHSFTACSHLFELNMQTGLADGADMEASVALLKWEHSENTTIMLTGIFPFKKQDYLHTIEQREKFEKLYNLCNVRVILDGRYLPGNKSFPKECRIRAYRQQAEYLLQACDILLAIADEKEIGKEGGTIETVGLALKKGVPVIFLSLNQICFFWLSRPGDLQKLASAKYSTLIKQPDELSQVIFNLLSTDDLEN